ncbi:MAG: hypothetical protein ACREUW_04335 [Burkholderiales bacterium]
MTGAAAQALPAYCQDAAFREQMRAIGPMVSVGASTSSGMLAKSFPLLAANQLCLSQGSGYASLHTYSSRSKFPFLKKTFFELRPKVIVAFDHLHHSGKRRRFDAETRKYLDAEIAMLTLDCRHPLIDCSPKGEFHFVETEHYRPVVLLGDIHAFYAVDCSGIDPFLTADSNDQDVGCLQDYDNINAYLRQKARENPTLHIVSVDAFYRDLHRGLPFMYRIGGKFGSFYTGDLFWDSWHPWSEPGAQIFANMALAKLNELIAVGQIRSAVSIPYIAIDDRYFKPHTGIVLMLDSTIALPPDQHARLVTESGAAVPIAFSDQTRAFRAGHGDWGTARAYEREAKSIVDRAGANPLVLHIKDIAENGDMVIAGEQRALLQKVIDDPRSQLLGGIIVGREGAP